MKLDYWTNYFRGFNPKEQLQVAEVIKNELQANERNKDDDDYDVSKSEQVRKYFETLLETASKKEDIEKRKDLLKKYDELSLKYRLKVLDETIETIEYIFKKQELEKGAAICQKEGHIFETGKNTHGQR